MRRPRSGRSCSGSPRAVRWRCSSPPRTRNERAGSCCSARWPTSTSGRAAENAPIELDRIERLWGTEEYARLALREWAAPSLADDERLVTWLASYTRRAASPGAAIALERMNDGMDASDILHAIHVPTLVIGRTRRPRFPDRGRAEDRRRHPGGQARRGSGPGQHDLRRRQRRRPLDEIEEFLIGTRHHDPSRDRVLATVLFTDIVGSTEHAAQVGDRAWRELLDAHDGVPAPLWGSSVPRPRSPTPSATASWPRSMAQAGPSTL